MSIKCFFLVSMPTTSEKELNNWMDGLITYWSFDNFVLSYPSTCNGPINGYFIRKKWRYV
jgi:hypothetical protein